MQLDPLPPIALYTLIVLDICGHLIPTLVGLRSFRRTLKSHGFNRLLYGYITMFSVVALVLLMALDRSDPTPYIFAQIAAWLTLPLWLCICEIARQSRREGVRREGAV